MPTHPAIIACEKRARAHRILTERNYLLQSAAACEINGPGLLELYTGPKGCILLHTRFTHSSGTTGVQLFADWPLGVSWEHLEDALKTQPDVQ